MLLEIFLLILGAVATYYTYTNLDRIYGNIEGDPYTKIAWLLKIGTLVVVVINTAAMAKIFENVDFLWAFMPIVAFVGTAYFLLIEPTMK